MDFIINHLTNQTPLFHAIDLILERCVYVSIYSHLRLTCTHAYHVNPTSVRTENRMFQRSSTSGILSKIKRMHALHAKIVSLLFFTLCRIEYDRLCANRSGVGGWRGLVNCISPFGRYPLDVCIALLSACVQSGAESVCWCRSLVSLLLLLLSWHTTESENWTWFSVRGCRAPYNLSFARFVEYICHLSDVQWTTACVYVCVYVQIHVLVFLCEEPCGAMHYIGHIAAAAAFKIEWKPQIVSYRAKE